MNKHHPVALSLLILSAFLLTVSLPSAGHTAPPWKDFEQPNAENDKDKNKGKGPPGKLRKKEQGDTLVICHRPPVPETASDTAQQKEIERVIGAPAWKAHEKHGDSKGGCGVVQLRQTVDVDPSNGLVQSAHLDSEGNLSVAVGSKKLLFYENGELSRSVDRLQHSHVYVSQTEENYVAETTKRGLRLFDSQGNRVNSVETPNILSTNNALFGTVLIGSYNPEGGPGRAAAYDLASGDELWSREAGNLCCGGIGRGGSDEYVLIQTKKTPVTYEITNIRTGDTVASLEGKPIVTGGVSENNTYVFATHSGELAVYDMDFEPVTSWTDLGLPKILPVLPMEFFPDRGTVLTPVPEKGLIVGNINTYASDTIPYPQVPFRTGDSRNLSAKDPDDGLYFISGYLHGGPLPNNLYKKVDRRVYVFNLEEEHFVDSIKLPAESLTFNSSFFGIPGLDINTAENSLVINLPTRVKIYRYGN